MSNRFFRPLFWPTLLTVLMLPILLGLGFWQLERLEWKEALLARIAAQMAAEPMALPAPEEWAGFDAKQEEYRRVRLSGHFIEGMELHYFTQDEDGHAGYSVISPFQPDGVEGAVVLVDRGFVPRHLKELESRPGSWPSGHQVFIGVLRQPHTRGTFDGVDDPVKNIWMVRDPAVMGAALFSDGTKVAPFVIEAEKDTLPGEWPQAGQTRIDIPNNHLDYALTWLGLAAVLVIIYLIYHRSQGRFGRPRPQ